MTIDRFKLVILLLLQSIAASAQSEFTRLNWQELCADSLLPVYSEVVPLESDYRLFDYSVRLRYAEWGPLNAAELRLAQRYSEQIGDTLDVRSSVAVSRGEGFIDIAFVPIVREGSGFKKLVSAKIEIVANTKPATVSKRNAQRHIRKANATDRYAASSVLANGRWAKVSIKEDGLYRLTFSQLRSLGFTNPANVRVYGYGGHRQAEVINADTDWDDLEPVALLPVGDAYVFYANGLMTWRNGFHAINHYARDAYYFVTEASEPTTAIEERDLSSKATAASLPEATTFTAYATLDPQEYAWYQGGSQLFEAYDYANGNQRSYTLTLPTYPDASSHSTLLVNFTAANATETLVKPTFNGTELQQFTITALGEYCFAMQTSRTYRNLAAPSTDNTITLSTTAGNSARLNYFELTYTGAMRIDAAKPQIQFEFTPKTTGEVFSIEYATGQKPQLWQLAEPGQPAFSISGQTSSADGKNTFRATVVGDGQKHRYVVFDANILSTLPTVTNAGAVANQDLHATEPQDMIIITPASGIFDSEAERLAKAHRQAESLRVKVVRADQIYNEFSSGTPDATAYRRFMKMLYDRAADTPADQPRYLLLFGDAAWDNRMITSAWANLRPENFLLCYESINSWHDVNSYVMEDYFGLLDDGEGANLTNEKVDLGIGRFPVRSTNDAKILVDKSINYIQASHAGAWKNTVMFLGDDGDNNQHLWMADSVANKTARLYPELEIRKLMWDAYQRQTSSTGNSYPDVKKVIDRQMEEGALLMNYVGHAATYCLSHEQTLRLEDFAAYASPRMPLWMTAACDVMPFDTQKENMGETAILNANGCAVAFYGTARTVYATKNYELNTQFCNALFGNDEEGRPAAVGDAVRLSKARLVGTEFGYYQNKLHYALLGDPALRFGSHGNRVVLDNINNIPVDELPADFHFRAGDKIRLTGHLEGADGQEMSDFHGTVTTHLYDSQRHVVCFDNDDSANAPFEFDTYDHMLYNGADSISAGRFSITVPVPVDISYSEQSGRLIFYALSDDRRTEANGYSEDFIVGGTAEGLDDSEGPKIMAYLGNEEFENGGRVPASPVFLADLEDENGINYFGTGLGHDLELIIDNSAATTYSLNDYFTGSFGDYSRGSVVFPIPTLSKGAHSLTFRAWDLLGNSSTATLDFVVDPSIKPSLFAVTTTSNPATTATAFILTYDRPGTPCDFTIELYDFAGRTLWQKSVSGSSATGVYTVPWDLTTGSGFPLGSGIYFYRARVSCDGKQSTTRSNKIIINRRQ